MAPRAILILLFSVVLATGPNALRGAEENQSPKDTNAQGPTFDDIRPLFQAKCWRCHGENPHKAELDLTTLAGVLKGGESGPVVVPGKPDESLLYEKVHSGSMPPVKKDRLSAAEVETVRRWIAAGAKSTSEAALTQHDIIPILLRHCTVCHGLRRQEAGLDLRTKSTMLRGGKSGAAIVPNKPDESLILKKIRGGQMPPRDRLLEVSIKPIEQSEIETLPRWIAAGPNRTSPRQPTQATKIETIGLSNHRSRSWSRSCIAPSKPVIPSTPLSCKNWRPKGYLSPPRPTGPPC